MARLPAISAATVAEMKKPNKLLAFAVRREARKKTAATKDRASEAAEAAGRAAAATGQATADAAKATAQGVASGAQAASRATARGGVATTRAVATAARAAVGRIGRAGAAASVALRGQPTGSDFVDSLYTAQQGRCHGCNHFALRGDLKPGPAGENGSQWALYCEDCLP